ncbi:MAG: hypothetical protein ACTTJ4_01865 [Treponema sp.]|uniref:hypothetical protein n=1 Tax=Treponema sp. TaxID=166 RepID=UPI003FA2F798
MKSTKVKIGFLLAALAAVLFTGCNQLTTKNVGTEFGVPGRTERIENTKRKVQKEAWNEFYGKFYNKYTGKFYDKYNLKTKEVSTETINVIVEAVNKKLKDTAEKNMTKTTNKFDKKRSVFLYGQLRYTGAGEKPSTYAEIEDVEARFSQSFEITVHGGDIEKYLDENHFDF